MILKDRSDAGKQLASQLGAYQRHAHTVVVGIARAGVIPAYFIAQTLKLPLVQMTVLTVNSLSEQERLAPVIKDQTVILVDDGLVTGTTIRSALGACKALGAQKIVIAAPVAPIELVKELRQEADDVVILYTPPSMTSVQRFYQFYEPVTNAEVTALLVLSAPKQR